MTMAEDPSSGESGIPAAYTYFGQFIDHDITKTVFDPSLQPGPGLDPIQAPNILPIAKSRVFSLISNARTAPLDLDSVYLGGAIESIKPDGSFQLSEVSKAPFGRIPTATKLHDLPRRPMIVNPVGLEQQELDRQAIIGDPRNDENLLVAQLHLGFLRTHNALMQRKLSAADAQIALRRRYQWAVLHDFLPRICDKTVVADVLKNGATVWQVTKPEDLFIPLEFSVAAYRFGHSMIRGGYSHNATFSAAPFNLFFTFTALSGDQQPGPRPKLRVSNAA